MKTKDWFLFVLLTPMFLVFAGGCAGFYNPKYAVLAQNERLDGQMDFNPAPPLKQKKEVRKAQTTDEVVALAALWDETTNSVGMTRVGPDKWAQCTRLDQKNMDEWAKSYSNRMMELVVEQENAQSFSIVKIFTPTNLGSEALLCVIVEATDYYPDPDPQDTFDDSE
jgi:hypothetical protein